VLGRRDLADSMIAPHSRHSSLPPSSGCARAGCPSVCPAHVIMGQPAPDLTWYGEWTRGVRAHVRCKHGISAKEYRARHGLSAVDTELHRQLGTSS
jgi:hypothetical protein